MSLDERIDGLINTIGTEIVHKFYNNKCCCILILLFYAIVLPTLVMYPLYYGIFYTLSFSFKFNYYVTTICSTLIQMYITKLLFSFYWINLKRLIHEAQFEHFVDE